MRRSLGLAIVVLSTLAAAGCGSDDTTATTPSSTAPTAGTSTFTATLAPGGTAMSQFTASTTGTVSVTLSATNPASTPLGLGIGIPGVNLGGCDLTKTVQALPGATAQLTTTVEGGSYCAGAFDIGTVGRNGVLVTVSVAHP
jgi:hypothetical protein